MNGRWLAHASGLHGVTEGFLEATCVHRLAGMPRSRRRRRRKQPDWVTLEAPVGAQQGEGARWQGNSTILVAFARANVQLHACAVNLGDLEVDTFEQAQATGVDQTQAHPIGWTTDLIQHHPDLVRSE